MKKKRLYEEEKKTRSTHAEGEFVAGVEAVLRVDDAGARVDAEARRRRFGRLHDAVLDAAVLAGVSVERHHLRPINQSAALDHP